MLTVQYPSSISVHYPSGFSHVRGFVIDQQGFILQEVTMPRDAPGWHKGIITAWLPAYMKRPRWDGARWVETHGWYRDLWKWLREFECPDWHPVLRVRGWIRGIR